MLLILISEGFDIIVNEMRFRFKIFILLLPFIPFVSSGITLVFGQKKIELNDYLEKDQAIYLSADEIFSKLNQEIIFSPDKNWLFIKTAYNLITVDLKSAKCAVENKELDFKGALFKNGKWYISSDFFTQIYAPFSGKKIKIHIPQNQLPKFILPEKIKKDPVDVIVIDPGHGGSNFGATAPEGWKEKDITLKLAKLLAQKLRAYPELKVYLTREQDKDLTLEERSAFANRVGADVFISIHANAYKSIKVSGVETYFLSLTASDEEARKLALWENQEPSRNTEQEGQDSETLSDLELILGDMAQSEHLAESEILAKIIQKNLAEALNSRNRGVRQAPFRVLMGVMCPAVLVEVGFLTNPSDLRSITDPKNQERIVNALCQSIIEFKNLKSQRLGLEDKNDTKEKARPASQSSNSSKSTQIR